MELNLKYNIGDKFFDYSCLAYCDGCNGGGPCGGCEEEHLYRIYSTEIAKIILSNDKKEGIKCTYWSPWDCNINPEKLFKTYEEVETFLLDRGFKKTEKENIYWIENERWFDKKGAL